MHFSRNFITTLNRLRSNHFNLNSSLSRKNIIVDPSCPCDCPSQDLIHVIFDCPLTEQFADPLRLALLEQDESNYSDLVTHALQHPSAKICRLFVGFDKACDRNF